MGGLRVICLLGCVYLSASAKQAYLTHLSVWGPLAYRLYVPEAHKGKLPLVVAIHGCKQSAEDFQRITRLNEHAEKQGFAVLYPEQSVWRNPDRCWNWFWPINQKRGLGEPELIMDLVESVIRSENLDRSRLFAMGLSSGGAMALTLGACYSDWFSAVGIHSGVPYAAAQDPLSAQALLEKGSAPSTDQLGERAAQCSDGTATRLRGIVLHGEEDIRVVPKNAELIFEQLVQMNDLIDDGKDNDSWKSTQKVVQKNQSSESCACKIVSIGNGPRLVQKIRVDGLGHEWSGGPAEKFSNPAGPDATRFFLDFFFE